MTENTLIRWRARLSRLVRYSVLASVGLGATVAFEHTIQGWGWLTAKLIEKSKRDKDETEA